MIHVTSIESPIGTLTLAVRAGRLCLLRFGRPDVATVEVLVRWYPDEELEQSPGSARAAEHLARYFDGDLPALDDIDVELNGTPFQQRVWNELRKVRAGSVASYAEIARCIGAASSVRAVGAANGANPVAIVIPCHRVIGTNGRLTGYGGGLERKAWLLRHEGVMMPLLAGHLANPIIGL
jgi:methylated-DNA-[protein]-cysteine S-methyltransferase